MRHTATTEKHKLQLIYTNAQPYCLWYIRRRYFTHLAELIELASDLEAIPTGSTSREAPRKAYPELHPGARRRDPPNERSCAPDITPQERRINTATARRRWELPNRERGKVVESGCLVAYGTSHTRPKDKLAIDFEETTSASSHCPLPGSGQQSASPVVANVDTRPVPTGQRSDVSISESQRYKSADGTSRQQEADAKPDGTDLRFENNRISATVIIAGQRKGSKNIMGPVTIFVLMTAITMLSRGQTTVLCIKQANNEVPTPEPTNALWPSQYSKQREVTATTSPKLPIN
uniref:Uncharacterized protein n=1 Tax=Glossina pallidipes TaxID=7398 RepID=A0A1A9ZP62_GLOPL